jgi:hypothetical protein
MADTAHASTISARVPPMRVVCVSMCVCVCVRACRVCICAKRGREVDYSMCLDMLRLSRSGRER